MGQFKINGMTATSRRMSGSLTSHEVRVQAGGGEFKFVLHGTWKDSGFKARQTAMEITENLIMIMAVKDRSDFIANFAINEKLEDEEYKIIEERINNYPHIPFRWLPTSLKAVREKIRKETDKLYYLLEFLPVNLNKFNIDEGQLKIKDYIDCKIIINDILKDPLPIIKDKNHLMLDLNNSETLLNRLTKLTRMYSEVNLNAWATPEHIIKLPSVDFIRQIALGSNVLKSIEKSQIRAASKPKSITSQRFDLCNDTLDNVTRNILPNISDPEQRARIEEKISSLRRDMGERKVEEKSTQALIEAEVELSVVEQMLGKVEENNDLTV